MAELVGGAFLGAAVSELIRAILDAKKKATSFQPLLTRLESTVSSISPHVDEINRLSHELDLADTEMSELIMLLQNRQALVYKCSKISTVNFVKKGLYSKQLLDLDSSLLRYFHTILPLEQYRDNKEILVMVRDLHSKLLGDRDGGICTQTVAGKPRKEEEEEEEEEDKWILVN